MERAKTIFAEEYSSIIKALKDERLRLGLSQLEVASEVGMTQSEISKVETLERKLDIYEFKLFLKAYRINSNNHLRNIVFRFFELELDNG